MSQSLNEHDDAHPDPSPDTVPVGPEQLDAIEDFLHLGWSWHRYRYVFRRCEHARILDAGCGTGLTSLGLAKLNRGSRVLGVDRSEPSLAIARQRLEAAGRLDVAFRQHDLMQPLPAEFGPFDFIVCRRVLDRVEEPGRALEHLARVADPRALLLLTVPGRGMSLAAGQLQRVARVLAPEGATLEQQAEAIRDLFTVLRDEHPLRQLERLASGSDAPPGVERIISAYLAPRHRVWGLEDLIGQLEPAGWKFLYVGAALPWRPDKLFRPDVPKDLRDRVAAIGDRARSILIDALDPNANLVEHRVYACLADFEPHEPAWPAAKTPEAIDALVPHHSGLGTPVSPEPGQAPALYRTVSGRIGQVDQTTDALLRSIDGRRTCGEINRDVDARLGVGEPPLVRRDRWLQMADRGLTYLESPDPRQNIDCVHLGMVLDRLDCPCPRKWVRACALHGACTIDPVGPDEPQRPAVDAALKRLSLEQVRPCATCGDYRPEPDFDVIGP